MSLWMLATAALGQTAITHPCDPTARTIYETTEACACIRWGETFWYDDHGPVDETIDPAGIAGTCFQVRRVTNAISDRTMQERFRSELEVKAVETGKLRVPENFPPADYWKWTQTSAGIASLMSAEYTADDQFGSALIFPGPGGPTFFDIVHPETMALLARVNTGSAGAPDEALMVDATNNQVLDVVLGFPSGARWILAGPLTGQTFNPPL